MADSADQSEESEPVVKKPKTEENVDQPPQNETELKTELVNEELTIKDEIIEAEEPGTASALVEPKPEKSTNFVNPSGRILQFKITLIQGKRLPKIWRRFQIPSSYTFRQFHLAIQKTMGWKSIDYDYHLHAFNVTHPSGSKTSIRMADDISMYRSAKNENTTNVADYFNKKGQKGLYLYDFGENWEHELVFEKEFEAVEGESYPKCIAGARACPPEDGVVDSDEEYDSDEFDPNACF